MGIISTATLASTVALMALGAAIPASAAPAQDSSTQDANAQDTINRLKSQGIVVRISRVGDAPINQCQITNISKLSTTRQLIPIFNDDDVNVFTQLPKQKVTVTLNCVS